MKERPYAAYINVVQYTYILINIFVLNILAEILCFIITFQKI